MAVPRRAADRRFIELDPNRLRGRERAPGLRGSG
jgi:hypothetical protein